MLLVTCFLVICFMKYSDVNFLVKLFTWILCTLPSLADASSLSMLKFSLFFLSETVWCAYFVYIKDLLTSQRGAHTFFWVYQLSSQYNYLYTPLYIWLLNYIVLPLFTGVVLFPEATLPLRVVVPNLIAGVERAMGEADARNTIGVVCVFCFLRVHTL